MRALLLALPLLLANTSEDPTIPPPIRAMLDAAMASGNEGEVATIVKYARTADPASADLVTRIASDWRDERLAVAQRRLQEADFLDLVKGRAELGGYVSQGNTENVGVTAAIDVRREGLEWRHKLTGRADYQQSLGVVTQERYLVAYEPNWKFDSRAYLYGAAQYERDRFSGFDDRVSLSTGAGYRAINSPSLRLDLELGPAYRRTRFIDENVESNLAARGSLDLNWKLSQGVTLTQNAAAYIQDANSTVAAKSALATKLIGPLSAQFSYSLQYESMPPLGRKTTDTISRAALVVDF
jgi:putative salt-induced outer membrane protein